MLAQRLTHVQQRMAAACQRTRRPLKSVCLIAVTKGVPVDRIREAMELGIAQLGENRVQEATEKYAVLDGEAPQVRWHMIGHLQRNKAKRAVEIFDAVHSVDSAALAQELEHQIAHREQKAAAAPLEIFIQVNVSGEATKSGCTPGAVPELAGLVLQQPHLSLKGLMTMAPFAENPEEARPHFRRLRHLRDELQRSFDSSLVTRHSPLLLSMGMSADFEVAIEEGADYVRIGTAIFGEENR